MHINTLVSDPDSGHRGVRHDDAVPMVSLDESLRDCRCLVVRNAVVGRQDAPGRVIFPMRANSSQVSSAGGR